MNIHSKNILSMLVVVSIWLLTGCGGSSVYDTTENIQPRVSITTPSNIAEVSIDNNESIKLVGSAVDDDGKVVSYEWREGNETLSTSNVLEYRSDVVGKHTLTFIATDDDGAIGSDSIDITILAPNKPPRVSISSTSEITETIDNNESIKLVGSAVDDDGKVVTYEWREGNETLATSLVLEYSSKVLGNHRLIFVATDDDGASATDTITIRVKEAPIKLDKSTKEQIASNWYVRLLIKDSARGMESFNTQLGQLDRADAVSQHTLKALKPFDGNYLDIVFHNPDGVEEGDYKVNFHTYEANATDSWEFTVRSSDSDAQLSLSIRGLYVLTPYEDEQGRTRYHEYRSISNPLLTHMKLVDEDTQEEISALVDGKISTYTFGMDGKSEKTFRFVLEEQVVQVSKLISVNKLQKIYNSDNKDTLQSIKKDIEFDLSKPPIVK